MQTLRFSITINAPVAKVRSTMLNHPTYEQRTSAFGKGGTYEGSRDEGSDIRFIDTSGQGMISKIIENKLYKYVSIKTIGEIMSNKKTNKLETVIYKNENIYENYTFSKIDKSITKLDIEMTGLPDSYTDMFRKMRPKALVILKKLCQ